jgi:hypothetical protein
MTPHVCVKHFLTKGEHMTAKRTHRRAAIAIAGIFLLCFATSPALADEIEERIRKLEAEQQANAEELARLKGQQLELKKQATEAAADLPTFTYRPRRGILIEAADKSWATRSFARFHYRAMFWPDRSTAAEESGFSQGDLALRRWRFGFNPSWQDDFYSFDLEFTGAGDRGLEIQKGELHVDFSKLNIYFPTLVFGIRPSAFFSRHDTNWGSSTGGFFDRSMFNDGSGIGAGSQNNGAGLYWSGVPFGPGRFLFQAIYSNQGLINVATLLQRRFRAGS